MGSRNVEDFGASLDITDVLSIKVGGTGLVSLSKNIYSDVIYLQNIQENTHL
jgi:hypothetical protein